MPGELAIAEEVFADIRPAAPSAVSCMEEFAGATGVGKAALDWASKEAEGANNGDISALLQHVGQVKPVELSTFNHVLADTRLGTLPKKDQVNLAWAALLVPEVRALESTTEVLPAVKAALKPVGFDLNRIQRVSDLIAPGQAKWEGFDSLNPLHPVHLRYPAALKQLALLNDAEHSPHSDAIAQAIEKLDGSDKFNSLQTSTPPLLLSRLPQSFSFVQMKNGPYAFLSHVPRSPSFYSDLTATESWNQTLSTALIRDGHHAVYNLGLSGAQAPDVVSLVTGPFERMSAISPYDMDIGAGLNFAEHVSNALRFWRKPSEEYQALDSQIGKRLGEVGGGGTDLDNQHALASRLYQFDSLDELADARGDQSYEFRGARVVHDWMLRRPVEIEYADGTTRVHLPWNEAVINSPQVAGIGVLRAGRSVILENLPEAASARLFGKAGRPDWLTIGNADQAKTASRLRNSGLSDKWYDAGIRFVPDDVVVVPEHVVHAAIKHDIPLVFL